MFVTVRDKAKSRPFSPAHRVKNHRFVSHTLKSHYYQALPGLFVILKSHRAVSASRALSSSHPRKRHPASHNSPGEPIAQTPLGVAQSTHRATRASASRHRTTHSASHPRKRHPASRTPLSEPPAQALQCVAQAARVTRCHTAPRLCRRAPRSRSARYRPSRPRSV